MSNLHRDGSNPFLSQRKSISEQKASQAEAADETEQKIVPNADSRDSILDYLFSCSSLEARKVQRVGYSTLTVSLPRDWVQEVKLNAGDIVSVTCEDDDSLKLILGTEQKREEVRNCVINVDLCNSPNLLTRIIKANYILGHDTIQVVARDKLGRVHLEEIRKTTQHLNGISIVEQTIKQVVLQNFVDPTRFPINGLLRRLHIIISSMVDASIKALLIARPELALEVMHMEEESDKIYWFIVRQLLLAVRDRRTVSEIGIDSPLHIVGNRMVAKALEEMADSANNIANEILALENMEIAGEEILKDISKFADQVNRIAKQSVEALFAGEIRRANEAVEMVLRAENDERRLTEKILSQVKDVSRATSLRIIIRNLGQFAKYCKIINEITINRVMETPSEICKYISNSKPRQR